MLQSYLKRRNISIYRLAKETDISYSTLNYIVNGRTPIEKCSLETFKKIADALQISMDQLYRECQYTLDDFEVFKSNVGHELQELGQLNFLEKYLISNEIETLWEYNKLNALYLIAMVDYVSRINGISQCSKYDKYRSYKLKEDIYPSSYYVHKRAVSTYKMENIIAEFERFGIIEGDVFNVQ